jgi:hypothetical protein
MDAVIILSSLQQKVENPGGPVLARHDAIIDFLFGREGRKSSSDRTL